MGTEARRNAATGHFTGKRQLRSAAFFLVGARRRNYTVAHTELISPARLHLSTTRAPVADTALELLAGADPDATVVGWFSARRCVPLRPSAREAAVCAALPAALAALQGGSRRAVDSAGAPLPPLLLLLSGEQPSDGNPFTFEYRAFESHSRSIPLRIANVGQALARGAQGAAPGGVTRRLPLPEGTLLSQEGPAACVFLSFVCCLLPLYSSRRSSKT